MSKADVDFVKKEWAKHKRQQDYRTPTAECWITENHIYTEDTNYDYCAVCERFKRIIKQLEKVKK